jgi:hypothetical protein
MSTTQNKFVEILDAATFIPALAIRISGEDGYLARRAGFGDRACVYLISLATERCAFDPYTWGNRTMTVAHEWIEAHWDETANGAVVDVEFILGERAKPKESEQFL